MLKEIKNEIELGNVEKAIELSLQNKCIYVADVNFNMYYKERVEYLKKYYIIMLLDHGYDVTEGYKRIIRNKSKIALTSKSAILSNIFDIDEYKEKLFDYIMTNDIDYLDLPSLAKDLIKYAKINGEFEKYEEKLLKYKKISETNYLYAPGLSNYFVQISIIAVMVLLWIVFLLYSEVSILGLISLFLLIPLLIAGIIQAIIKYIKYKK